MRPVLYSATILFTVARGNRTKKANLEDVVALWQRNRDVWLYGAPVRIPLFHRDTNPIYLHGAYSVLAMWGVGDFPAVNFV